ncbi:methyl-accepting chemotaxis protein [Vogesella sp. LIG4]|uniref:methyl-accepting chemotaxis protein n=1 Tax=Vogesella sp. LIG4 TaxID=1192162 RepID=UPI00081F7672|nr:methyl-accepting chemotaxis protein [Vogesella sp. LIG4]SCK18940.1 methyl-accepting chemotaxis protein [Vogesella sp. LIG4]
MKISQRMILLITVAIAGMLLLTVNTFMQLSRMNQQLENISDNVLPSIKILGDAAKELVETRNSVLTHIMANDAGKKTEIEAEYKDNRDSLSKDITLYTPLIVNDQDGAYLNKLKNGAEELDKQYDSILAASHAGQTEEATRLANGLRDKFKEVQQVVVQHIAFNEQLAETAKAEARNVSSNARLISSIIAALSVILLLLLGMLSYRQIVGSVKRGQISIQQLSDSLDFTTRCDVQGRDEIAQMLTAFNQLIEKLQSSLRSMVTASRDVAQSATELASSARQVAAGSNAQSESASAMAAALEQITVSINHVADRTQEANGLAQDTGSRAQNGEVVITGTSHSIESIAGSVEHAAVEMGQLSERTREIAVVVNVIKDVADQTNLLALNAAIEAARAGEMGRGFAVVADEVRKLAERTAQSTQEIAAIIGAIQTVSESASERMQGVVSNVESGVQEADKARGAIRSIAEVAEQSRHLVGEISHAIREQGTAANSIAMQVENVAQMAEENSASAAHVTDLASRLQGLSQSMEKEVSVYRV